MRKINSAKRQIELGADRIKILWSDAISRIKAACSTRVCVFFSARPHTTTNPLGAHPSLAFYFNSHCAIQLTSQTEISGPVAGFEWWRTPRASLIPLEPLPASWLIQWKSECAGLLSQNTQLGVYWEGRVKYFKRMKFFLCALLKNFFYVIMLKWKPWRK